MPRVCALVLMALSLALVAPVTVLAQDASPAASPMAGPCDAPELPPGTPTPMDEATPAAAMEATPVEDEAPVVEEAPAGTPVDAAAAGEAEAAVENLFNCLNSGDFLAAGALMTDNFIQSFVEVSTVYDVPATFEGVQPVEARSLSNAQSYADGSVSIDTVYSGLFSGPGALSSARLTFVEEDGYYKLDNYQDITLPEGALPGATVIDVQMVDFAFALSEYTVPANTPVILRTTNNSGSGSGHVNVVVTYEEGTTAEGLIEGEVNLEEAATGFFGALFLEPGMSGDLAFESLAPGTYFLVCDVETADGTPHYEVGMGSQVTVE
ncbi:MAG: hypothetical protein H0T18_02195 [Chloroflexia bacterium]|nr:hypothetical protein [Chloroflexia bacterium]